MQILRVIDLSAHERYGVKGPQTAKWLASHGVATPKNANAWVLNEGETLVMRLGTSEFLIEDQSGGKTCEKLASDTKRVTGVYRVPHADASYLLAGSGVLNMLSELCALDLRESALAENDLVMTQLADISATILRQRMDNETVYRIWCDGTYGVYMQHVLRNIAVELGGCMA